MQITVDQNRMQRELAALASLSDAPPPAVTRIVFSAMDLKARAYLDGIFSDAGLVVRKDRAGNNFARWIGSEPELPVVGTGSHADAIPFAGSYDGTVGLLGGLEAIRALQRAGFRPRRSIELLMFTSEEPTRFGIGCLGLQEAAKVRRAASAREIIAVGAIMVVALERSEDPPVAPRE